MKYKLPKTSDRGRIRKRLGKLHLAILQTKRGDRCEICGKPDKDLARFHIFTVAAHPRLEFFDDNIFLYARSHWHYCHEPYHRDRDSKLGQFIMARIKDLRGKDYLEKLREAERWAGKHDGLYLMALERNFKKELEALICAPLS